MIQFTTLKKFVFLGRQALHKMSNYFETSSYVVSFTVLIYFSDIEYNSYG